MEELKQKIINEGQVIGTEILKVDCFLNHQLDVAFLDRVAKEFYERYKSQNIDKILTVEVSGIAIAVLTARYFDVPVLFAKKLQSKTLNEEMYEAQVHSFTKQINYNIRVAKKFLNEEDHVLIIDDFLAKGQAALGLAEICNQAGATVEGIGIVIEKDFQEGGAILRDSGYRVDSLARIIEMNEEEILFGEE
jgi:xanthine phosphoribosyltransferase